MKIAFTTLGCKLNYAETSTYRRGFEDAGWEVVSWSAKADYYLVNSCAVTETAEKKSRNLIRRAHNTAPEARIIVTGCYAQLRRDELLSIDGVWKVFGADEKSSIVSSTLNEGIVPQVEEATFGAYSSGGDRTRSFLKVQDGCDNFCAYCTVPFARGRSRNIPVCQAVKAAGQIAEAGVKEIVLTGVNTGDFGRTTGEDFLSLLKALDKVEGIERYRISSIEPNLITPEIVHWIASGTKFQPHFHIPLQVGNDLLLRQMGRRYDTALFASRIDLIREAMEGPGKPKVFFGIDVIVGLPGETDQFFMETYKFLEERIRPAFIHVFPYSKRPGTRAAKMNGQVKDSIKTERVAKLEELCARLHSAFIAENKGIREKVLWESSVKNGLMGGYTGNYIRLERPYEPSLVNCLEDIVI